MDLFINEYLKIDSRDRILFYPAGFTSTGYVVPSERLKRRIVVLHRLRRFSILVAGVPSLGVLLLADVPEFLAWGLAIPALHGVEALWDRYLASLAETLEKAPE